MSKVFISYARDDDAQFVEMLSDSLNQQLGIQAWFDRTSMESRGLPFLFEIREAICKSERVIAVLGPAALKSPYVQFELRCACHFSKVLIPVLRKGSYKELSKESTWPDKLLGQSYREYLDQAVELEEFDFSRIAQYHCLDFRSNRPYDEALSELLRILDAEIRPLARIHPSEPDLPVHFKARVRHLTRLRELVGRNFLDMTSIPIEERVTAIYGDGGSGKTVLAAAFVRSTTARRVFRDGIFWLQAGQEPNLLNELKKIGDVLDNSSHYNSVELAQEEVQHLLANRCCLLVVDDVWESEHAARFKRVLGDRCSLLITTEKKAIGETIGGQVMQAAKLSLDQALQMLADWSEYRRENLPAVSEIVAERCGYLPLPLAICGSLVRTGEVSWQHLPEKLDRAREEVLEADFPGYHELSKISVFTPIRLSLEFIKKLDDREERQGEISLERYRRYLELAVLPVDRKSPQAVVLTLWLAGSAVQDEDLLCKVLARLRGRALLELFPAKPPFKEVLLHHLQHVYLRAKVGDQDLRALHTRISGALLEWWPRQSEERGEIASSLRDYCVQYLVFHLVQAQLWGELAQTLGNVQFLRQKQKAAHQERLQTEIVALLRSDEISDASLAEVFSTVQTAIVERMKDSVNKADWLDTLAYWIHEFGFRKSRRRAEILRPVAHAFDQACGEVAGTLARTSTDSGKALRFAELETWVYQRSGFWKECEKACVAAVEQCEVDGVEEGYRMLGPIEFVRMRARALSALGSGQEDAAEQAYLEAGRRFANVGALGWKLEPDQWRSFEKDTPRAVARFEARQRGNRGGFTARLVSNTHDCVSAIFILQYLESLGGTVDWVHFDKFKPDRLGSEGILFTVIIGGPKSPGSQIANAFYRADRPGYLKMYSGLYFEPSCLRLDEKGTHCYWLGGVSKIHTLRAAYDFSKDPEVESLVK